ncbi:DUF3784 domain-containing protein [Methanimicrococcus blatticola]|uniref:Uncharacterized protein DUF3784 n=1 Tax=Methanimicrococcus blatticola TaxID=91560 RepID=A0A484F4R6_9EURY|nr:DUF3784 domain-containing protein [Methanimicrococcus blatticola]MBZ3935307.1 DUF3784 domain-containing protein [Methanimicrococcus blatticola]MCC2508595.1 DUF3784 domain-containing protein [Methanimicrococcus blatticola]TDQ67902.1 uncharacterized protein DUF3784 [Methanimicrococcus blatticola]
MAFETSYLAFLFPVFLAAMALYFFSGRGAFLISGYNTLPKEEQEKYNLKELTRAMGIFTIVLAVLMTATLFAGIVLNNSMYALVGIICILVFTAGWLYYMNQSKKMKNTPF